jgi:hypothetical protein
MVMQCLRLCVNQHSHTQHDLVTLSVGGALFNQYLTGQEVFSFQIFLVSAYACACEASAHSVVWRVRS